MDKWEENELKKEYLKSYQKAKKREQRILDEIQRLRADKMFPSLIYDDMPHGSGHSDLSDYAVKLDEQIEELKQERLEQDKIYKDIERRIYQINDDTQRKVLRLKYFNGAAWQEVAHEVGCSPRHVYDIHRNALQNICFQEDEYGWIRATSQCDSREGSNGLPERDNWIKKI